MELSYILHCVHFYRETHTMHASASALAVVILSVCLSHACFVTKTKQTMHCIYFDTTRKGSHSSFTETNSGWWATPVMKSLTVDQPSTFELVCTRIVAGRLTAIVAAVCRPGSAPIKQLFLMSSVLLEQLATYQAPVYIVGDFNIHVDRPGDSRSVQFRLLVDWYSLMLHQTTATHQLGGTVDAVITRKDVDCPGRVEVVDVGLSDHHRAYFNVQWYTKCAVIKGKCAVTKVDLCS